MGRYTSSPSLWILIPYFAKSNVIGAGSPSYSTFEIRTKAQETSLRLLALPSMGIFGVITLTQSGVMIVPAAASHSSLPPSSFFSSSVPFSPASAVRGIFMIRVMYSLIPI